MTSNTETKTMIVVISLISSLAKLTSTIEAPIANSIVMLHVSTNRCALVVYSPSNLPSPSVCLRTS